MRRVYYSSGSVLTDDAIAAVVLEYAEALGKSARADIVEIPIILESGNRGTATLLIGPSSQLASVTEESTLTSPRDDDLVEEIRTRSRKLDSPRPMANQFYGDASHEDYE